MTTKDVIAFIVNSDLNDADLDGIRQAMAESRRIAAAKVRASLSAGDRVTFKSTIKPAYLAGVKATVTKINREKIVIDLDVPTGRFFRNVVCPVSVVQPL